jgi:uncharacterized membrane protein YedE/YeeE
LRFSNRPIAAQHECCATKQNINWATELQAKTPHYFAQYGGGDKNPLKDWLVYEAVGVIAGGLLSGFLAKRLGFRTDKGPRITVPFRLALALLGGGLVGFGARLAQGCASGQALTGGATLALGSWAVMMAMFAGAYGLAYFVRKQWI